MNSEPPTQATDLRELLESLGKARGAVESFLQSEKVPANQVETLRRAHEHAQFAARRLGGLWIAARFLAGTHESEQTQISIHDLMESAAHEVATLARERQVKIRTNLESTPPILGDPTLMHSMMVTVLSHALSGTEGAGELWISGFEREGKIIVKLEDQSGTLGSRLEPALRPDDPATDSDHEIQEAFPDPGAVAVKPILEAHGGDIKTERQGESAGAVLLSLPKAPPTPTDRESAGKLILIIEDDGDSAFMLEQELENAGFSTEVAYDGLSGLARAKSGEVGLVILDVMLPGMDGFEVCHQLREDPRTADLPIVMVSAKGRPEDRETGLRMGADAYLTKPLALPEVIERIQDLMERPQGA